MGGCRSPKLTFGIRRIPHRRPLVGGHPPPAKKQKHLSKTAFWPSAGFEKLGWIRKEKLHKNDYKQAQKLDLQIGAVKYRWYVKDVSKGEIKTTDSSRTYTNSQSLADLDKTEALTAKTFTL